MSRGDSIVARSRFCQVNPLTSGCQASGARESSRAGVAVRTLRPCYAHRTLGRYPKSISRLTSFQACSGWRFNVILEWQICNAYGFTIYRRRGYLTWCATFLTRSPNANVRSGSSLTSTYYQSRKNDLRTNARPINHSINIYPFMIHGANISQ